MGISKKEYRGAIWLGALALMLLIANQLVHRIYSNRINSSLQNDESAYLDSLVSLIKMDSAVHRMAEATFSKPGAISELALHPFDPNTISREDWVEMGLPEWVFNGFEKYRLKGGRIRKPDQILKLYNLDSKLGQKMIPYIRIDSGLFAKPRVEFESKPRVFEKKEKVLFDLNQADTTQLMTVFGIGRGIANRIVRYRNNLGGFHSKSQVYEVFALDSIVVDELFTRSFLSEQPKLTPLQINSATEEELGKHPYIRKSLARYIFKYRQQHGPYSRPEDLLEIKVMNPEVVEKLRPYLAF